MPAPLIGLTTSRFNNTSGILMVATPSAYVTAVLAAGATPVLIPTGLPAEQAAALAARLDGILFTGGGDVDIRRFNGRPHDRVSDVDEARDELEITLAQQAARSGQPFLGICRGAQVVNVALGGSLFTDVPDQYGRSVRHDWFPKIRRDHLAHRVTVDPGSRLAQILGTQEVEVNSIHHQAVENIAPGLTVTGHAPDGLVESLELDGHPFGILVQWHPEWLPDQEPMRRLFKAFAGAAANGKDGQRG